jgi:Outer membrane protein beta-barrel domain
MQKKTVVLLVCVALITGSIKAQCTNHLSFGFRGGVNFQNINGKGRSGGTLSNTIVPKFHIGVNIELPVAGNFYVQPGLLFITKGEKNEQTMLSQPTEINLSYLEVPVNLLYKPVLGRGKLLLGLGPYIAFGIGGNSKIPASGVNKTFAFDVKFKNTVKTTDRTDKTYIKPIDAGASLLFGYELSNKFSAQLNAQLGLTKINPAYEGRTNDKSSWKNTGFGISIGYRL